MQENRYSRHELLKEVGVEGQKRISQGRVLIIGAGGLGSPASLYLASSGVKKITIVDSDTVDLTNLQRQVIHNVERLGMNKAESAKVSLEAINPEVEITDRLSKNWRSLFPNAMSLWTVPTIPSLATSSMTFADVSKNRSLRPESWLSTVKSRSSTLEILSRLVMPVFFRTMKAKTRRLPPKAFLHP